MFTILVPLVLISYDIMYDHLCYVTQNMYRLLKQICASVQLWINKWHIPFNDTY